MAKLIREGEGLKEFPGHEAGLVQVQLQNNRIGSIPEEIAHFDSLLILDLSFNLLEVLPSALSKIPLLETLLVPNNRLTSPCKLPLMLQLTNLDISHNGVTSLHADSFLGLPKLRELNLSNNSMKNLPSSFRQDSLANLRALDVSHNHLCRLPWYLAELSALETIDISHNNLLQVPALLLQRPALRFNIDANPFVVHALLSHSKGAVRSPEHDRGATEASKYTPKASSPLVEGKRTLDLPEQPRAAEIALSTSYGHLMAILEEESPRPSSSSGRERRHSLRADSPSPSFRRRNNSFLPHDESGLRTFSTSALPIHRIRTLLRHSSDDIYSGGEATDSGETLEEEDEPQNMSDRDLEAHTNEETQVRELERQIRRLNRRLNTEQKIRSRALEVTQTLLHNFCSTHDLEVPSVAGRRKSSPAEMSPEHILSEVNEIALILKKKSARLSRSKDGHLPGTGVRHKSFPSSVPEENRILRAGFQTVSCKRHPPPVMPFFRRLMRLRLPSSPS